MVYTYNIGFNHPIWGLETLAVLHAQSLHQGIRSLILDGLDVLHQKRSA